MMAAAAALGRAGTEAVSVSPTNHPLAIQQPTAAAQLYLYYSSNIIKPSILGFDQ